MQTDVFTQEPVMVGGFAVGETDPDRLLGKYDNYVKVSTRPLLSLSLSLRLSPALSLSPAHPLGSLVWCRCTSKPQS